MNAPLYRRQNLLSLDPFLSFLDGAHTMNKQSLLLFFHYLLS